MKKEEQMEELQDFLERLRVLHEKDREGSEEVEEARRKAIAILKNTEEELADVYLSLGEGVKREVEKEKASVEKEIAAFKKKTEKELSKKTKALERVAEKNMNEAVEFILTKLGARNA